MKRYISKTKQPSLAKAHRKKLIITGLLVVIVVVAGLLVFLHYHKKPSVAVSSSSSRNIYSKPQSNSNVPGGSGNASAQSGISSSKNGGATNTSPQLPASAQPSSPVGQFVSDHKPNISGHPAPNTESSTCTTTPGAKCQIQFTSGATTKSLPAQLTDQNGNTSWNWTLQSVGLTQGTWQVTAIATNGSRTATATDVNKLIVSP